MFIRRFSRKAATEISRVSTLDKAVTLLTSICEIPGSNLKKDCHDWGFCNIFCFNTKRAGVRPRIRLWQCSSSYFTLHLSLSSKHSTLRSLSWSEFCQMSCTQINVKSGRRQSYTRRMQDPAGVFWAMLRTPALWEADLHFSLVFLK